MNSSVRVCGVVCALLGSAGAGSADVVTDWNVILLDSIRATSQNPPRASRMMAMTHTAMYDAIIGIEGGYARYAVRDDPQPHASPIAAGAAAAHRVLVSLFPARQAIYDAALAQSITGIPVSQRNKGLAYGALCGNTMLALRANDNSNLVVPYNPVFGPGVWVPTPPAFAPALLPNWPLVTPFCMASGSQYRSGGPPALASSTYAADFNEVKSLGSATSATRTPEQTEIARFWADGAGTVTPPGHWLAIARDVSTARGLTLVQNARLFALVSLAVCDAGIVSWDNKYAYNHWRPVTAIRNADIDGNPLTEMDPAWAPLIVTPPFPSYTSGHSTFSSAAATVMDEFFNHVPVAFSTTSEGVPGVHRHFSNFWQAAQEAGRSRIYGGIHYEYENVDAQMAGRALGASLFTDFLTPWGDLNGDGHVTRLDLGLWNLYVTAGMGAADIDRNGVVDRRDGALLRSQMR